MRHFFSVILGLYLLWAVPVSATHLRSGQIIVEQIIPGSLTVKITVQVWTNTSSSVQFGGDQDLLNFGDGTSVLVPEQVSQPIPGVPGNLGLGSYTVQHTYQGYGAYVVSYREPMRNVAILNIANSLDTFFYLESYFHLLEDKAYKSPILLQQPFFVSDISIPISTSIAATDKNDFALKYFSVVPRQDANTEVLNFIQPESFDISENLGIMTWDNEFQGGKLEGEYLFTARIDQYLPTNEGWLLVGYMYRDFQIIVIDNGIETSGRVSDNLADENNRLYSEKEQTKSFKVFAYHEPGESAMTEVKTELPAQNIEVTSYDSTYLTQNISVTQVSVSTTEDIVRNNPYFISVRTTFSNGELVYIQDLNFPVFTLPGDFFELPTVVAVNTREKENISLAPNPVDKFLMIRGESIQSTISFINIQGRNTLEVNVVNGICDVSELPPGLYYVILRDHNRNIISQEKIIKQ